MRKIAEWPPQVGTAEHASFVDVNEDPDKDIEEHSHEHPDSFVPEKSVLEDQETITDVEGGIISPVDGVDWEYNLADDQKKASVEIYNDDNLMATFNCNVAITFQDKVAGLQIYPSLEEGAGLLFPYKQPQDVIYHMGTVKYPIDIIFIDNKNTVKKIYKDIPPGTLGTFGCANVKNVLEICGGLSARLGISTGAIVRINKGHNSLYQRINKIASKYTENNNVIISYSKFGRTGLSNWKNFPILTINTNLNKFASNESPPKIVSDLINSFSFNQDRHISVFDFDGILDRSSLLNIYKVTASNDDNISYIRLDGHAVSIQSSNGKDIFRQAKLNNLLLKDDEAIISSLNKSFKYFMRTPDVINDVSKLFKEVRAAHHKGSEIIFVTRYDNPKFIRNLICSRIKMEFGDYYGLEDIDILQINKNADAHDVISILRSKYGNLNYKIYSDESIIKRGGEPVSDDIKGKSKRAYRYLDSASEDLDTSLDNMQLNLEEYGKIKENSEALIGSKDDYQKSMKRQAKIVKNYLVKIREAIRILNDIKDVSTTFEIIDSLAVSAKKTSDGVEEIFELGIKLDNPDFYTIFTEKVDQYGKLIEDLKSVINGAKQYINKEILGLMVLSS